MVTILPVELSDLRSAVRFAKPYGPAQCEFVYAKGPSVKTIISDFVYIAPGDGLQVNSEYI